MTAESEASNRVGHLDSQRLMAGALDAFLFAEAGGTVFVTMPLPDDRRGMIESFESLWLTLDVPGVRVVALPDGAKSLRALRDAELGKHCGPIYVVPGFDPPHMLGADILKEHGRQSLDAASLALLLQALPRDARIGLLLPWSNLQSRWTEDVRTQLLSQHRLDTVVFHGRSFHPSVHRDFEFASVFARVGGPAEGESRVTRFFQVPAGDPDRDVDAVIADMRDLAARGGGSTTHGYVHRGSMDAAAPITFEKFHPLEVARRQDEARLGDVRPLSELVDVVPSVRSPLERELQDERWSPSCVQVVTARCVGAGKLDLEASAWVDGASIGPEVRLKEGDICVRTIYRSSDRVPIRIARVTEEDLPLVAGGHVIALRPRQALGAEEYELLIGYLHSEAAARSVRSEGGGVHLTMRQLLALPVPVPDADLVHSLRTLAEATERFQGWLADAEQARSRLFDFKDVGDARLHVLAAGRKIRQRLAAATQVDDMAHRIRTRFPHPIAYRWRTVEASAIDLEGYVHVLEAAESAVQYIALVAVALVRSQENLKIKKLAEIASRVARGRRSGGFTFGDWRAVLHAVNNGRAFRQADAEAPLYEVARYLDSEDVRESISILAEARNDQAHGRGPKGADVSKAMPQMRSHLTEMLDHAEFLSDYPLRFVEDVRWDSLKRRSRVEYRELMGDHPLAPLQLAEVEGIPLEAGSLYLVDRSDQYHLMRPLLTRFRCPKCGNVATFALDDFHPESGACFLKSLEHGHPHEISDESLVDAFRKVGLLPLGD